MITDHKKVAIIILNYNGRRDTVECLESLQKIDYPDYWTVVVDNASSDGSVEKIKSWAAENGIFVAEYNREIAEQGGIEELEKKLHKYSNDKKIVLIKNSSNLGYSAGNNVGIRYAIKKNADAVLIVNPDVRFEEPSSLQKMTDVMFSDNSVYVVGPNIIDAHGKRQGPLREPSFLEEVINPFLSMVKNIDYRLPVKSGEPFKVEKVAGCCLLIKTSFLKQIGLLDEKVFLYCEEPILSAQVKNSNGIIIFMPTVTVRHLHNKPKKENMKIFFNSRLYYLKNYKGFNKFQLLCITLTHKLLTLLNSKN